MGDRTGIEWTRGDDGTPGATWNPVVGCAPVSPGCDNCYAAREASGRLAHLPAYDGLARFGKWTGEVRTLPDRLAQPLSWTRPRRVFVNSMSDLFHPAVPRGFVADVFAVMGLAEQHTFQVLTKRPDRMRRILSDPAFVDDWFDARNRIAAGSRVQRMANQGTLSLAVAWPLPNVWLGTSIESDEWAIRRMASILHTPAAVRFLSIEPLLAPVNLWPWLTCPHTSYTGHTAPTPLFDDEVPSWVCDGCGEWHHVEPAGPDRKATIHDRHGDWVKVVDRTGGPDWVIVGGESGHDARPMHPDWVRAIRDACVARSIPFLFKQWGEWAPLTALPADVTDHPTAARRYPQHTFPDGTGVYRIGKHDAGRTLDGRTWDEYPDGP